MKYQDAAAFRMALEQRLKDGARDGAELSRDRKRVAFDRLLVRLQAVAADRWMLKGGFALDLRLAARARSTKDVDIEWRAEEGELADTLLDAADHDAGDFFVLSIERTTAPADRLGGAHRFRVSASLAGRPFETFLLDVGLRADDTAGVETLRTDDLLVFAGIESIEIPAISIELQIAEKLHAYTQTYEGGRASTRVKDLVDLVLIAELSSLDAVTLRREIESVFERRGAQAPSSLSSPAPDWALPFGRLAEEVGISADLDAGHQDAAAMLDPVLGGKVTDGEWSRSGRAWVQKNRKTH
jgi:Nucleotidyl transferase AbiEii toxin, Type IV TA system